MTEILVPGKVKYYALCPNCNCFFSYQIDDIEYDQNKNEEVVICPECSCSINTRYQASHKEIEKSGVIK